MINIGADFSIPLVTALDIKLNLLIPNRKNLHMRNGNYKIW